MQSAIRFALFGAIVVTLGGCATYSPSPLDPQGELRTLAGQGLPLIEVTRAASDTTSPSAPPARFDPSDGLDEAEVVSVALALNQSLRAQRAIAGESQAALITSGQWPNPQVGVSLRPGIGGSSSYAVGAEALFQLLQPGERDARKRAATAQVEQANDEAVAAEYVLVAEVRRQRLAVLAADRTVSLLEQAVQLRQQADDLVRRRREIGEANELDVSAVELDLVGARRDLRHAKAARDLAVSELTRLLGLPPGFALTLAGVGEPLSVTLFEDIADAEIDRRLLAGRIELRAKQAAYRKAEEDLRLAILRQYPRLGLGPSFERDIEGDKSLGLGLSIEVPLLNRNQGEIAERGAARDRVRAEYVELLHRLRAEAFAARAAVRAARTDVDAQEAEVLPVLDRNQSLFERAYRTGELNVIDWITAQQRALNARREYLDGVVAYRRATIDLEAATGSAMSRAATQPSTRPN